MTETAPFLNRPATIEEYDPTDQMLRHNLVTVHDLQRLIRVPGALAAIDQLVAALGADGARVDTSNPGQISMTRDATDDDLARHLVAEQARYDRGRELYQTYLDTGELPKHRYTWALYLRLESIPAPHDAASVDEVDD